MIEVDFGDNLLDKLVAHLKPGQPLSATAVLTVLDGEDEVESFRDMNLMDLSLDISDLPKAVGTGEAALRLRTEAQLVQEGKLLSGLKAGDPLRLYLEELASIPACGDMDLLALDLTNACGDEKLEIARKLLNLSLSRVVDIAGEYTGYGVLLLDLIQEASLGLWGYLPLFRGGDFAAFRDSVIRNVMKRELILQAHANGVGQKMRQTMEDYRSVDERLLTDLGRNPTLEEIAQALHISEETAASVAGMIDAARMVSRIKAEPEEDPQEEEQAVEDTAYFQMRQRIAELLTSVSEMDARLLTLRFGLEGGLPMSPEEAGKKLGLTAEEAIKREQAALAVLRKQNH